jgi:carbon-monoxide dehydrogenase medium subunit
VAEARIAVGSVGIKPVRVPIGESLLLGADAANIDPVTLDAAGRAAAEAADPVTDANGSPDYKQDLVRVLVGRCVRTAVEPLLARA